MKITDVKVFPVDEDKLKAYATITFENCFIVRDLKVISGNKGYFIAMPSKKRKDGTFRDVAHPLNSDTRKMIEDAVLEVYEAEEVSSPAPVASEDTGGYGTADPAPAVEEQVEDAPPVEADVSEPEAEVESAEETGFEAEPEIATTDSTEDDDVADDVADGVADDVAGDVSDDVDRETDSDSEKDDIAKEDAPEIGESMVSAADNPTIEPVDDPEKAFGYEE
jgi:stage V sporulation protein G